jgi:hypothetical protein
MSRGWGEGSEVVAQGGVMGGQPQKNVLFVSG